MTLPCTAALHSEERDRYRSSSALQDELTQADGQI